MGVAKKDDNFAPTLVGLSCIDGVTPIPIKFNPSNGGMEVDSTTVISVVPQDIQSRDNNDFPITKGVSSADGVTVLPWYVVPSTGAVLVDGL